MTKSAPHGSHLKATFAGLLAIPIWSLLASLTALAGAIPPLELVAITFTLGAGAGCLFLAVNARARRELRSLPFAPILIGIAGLFGYHFSYFLALQNAPAIEANLVNYLWPVLIVLFSAVLPASTGSGGLTLWHMTGALTALAGAVLAIGGGQTLTLEGNGFGYAMALVAALTWSSYSVATRLFRAVPSSAVAIYCAGTAALAWIAHWLREDTIMPATPTQAVAVIAMGVGPIGAAFFVWDYGCKHGDLRVLGVTAYFAPLLSTALLISTGLGAASPSLWLAALLITGGALIASKDLLRAVAAANAASREGPLGT